VSVLNTVNIDYTVDSPYSVSIADGFPTRLLRATKSADPSGDFPTLNANISISGNVEDTVRVVGLSGAWPVNTFAHGLTNINNYDTKLPMLVDASGALAVYLASGSISVTADVGSLSIGDVTMSGISLAYPTGLSKTIPIVGYTGSDAVPVAVTGSVNIMGMGLTHLNDISVNTARVLGASGDYIGITGDVRDKINDIEFTTGPSGLKYLQVFDLNSSAINTSATTVAADSTAIKNIFQATSASPNKLASQVDGVNAVNVDVKRIAQPTGGTSGRIAAPSGGTQMGSLNLESGIHFKSDLSNSGVVFVGFNNQVSTQIGFPLYAGDQIFIETNNLNNMYVSSTINGATVYFIGT